LLKVSGGAGAEGTLRSHPIQALWLKRDQKASWAPRYSRAVLLMEGGPLAIAHYNTAIKAIQVNHLRRWEPVEGVQVALAREDLLGALKIMKVCSTPAEVMAMLQLTVAYLIKLGSPASDLTLLELLIGVVGVCPNHDAVLFGHVKGGEAGFVGKEKTQLRLLRIKLFHHLLRRGQLDYAAMVATRISQDGEPEAGEVKNLMGGQDCFADLHLTTRDAGQANGVAAPRIEQQASGGHYVVDWSSTPALKMGHQVIADFAKGRTGETFKADLALGFADLVLDEMKMEDLALHQVDTTGIRLEARGRLVEAEAYYTSVGQFYDANRVLHYRELMQQPLTETMQDMEPLVLGEMTEAEIEREAAATARQGTHVQPRVASSRPVRGVLNRR